MRAHTIATASPPRGMARRLVVALVLGVSALAVLVSASGSHADAPVDGFAPTVHRGRVERFQPARRGVGLLARQLDHATSGRAGPTERLGRLGAERPAHVRLRLAPSHR